MYALFLLIFSIILTPATPEDFLNELCVNSRGTEGAGYWASHASSEVQNALHNPDSLAAFLGGMRELSVNPGARTDFEDRGNTFLIEFGESRWTWKDSDGNYHRIDGPSIVICSQGSYAWSKLPVFSSGHVSIGRKEKLVSGIMITFLILTFALILLIWANRRYL